MDKMKISKLESDQAVVETDTKKKKFRQRSQSTFIKRSEHKIDATHSFPSEGDNKTW